MKQTDVQALKVFLEENGCDVTDRQQLISIVNKIRAFHDSMTTTSSITFYPLSATFTYDNPDRVFDFQASLREFGNTWQFTPAKSGLDYKNAFDELSLKVLSKKLGRKPFVSIEDDCWTTEYSSSFDKYSFSVLETDIETTTKADKKPKSIRKAKDWDRKSYDDTKIEKDELKKALLDHYKKHAGKSNS